ncbi:MAG: hypothetical protein ACYTJ0_09610, partial [Planctomycetota bacterium]
SDDFGVVGTQYVADFTSSGSMDDDSLIGGNLNDDEWIDIIDFGGFVGQYGMNYMTADTTCATPPVHADINGGGTVETGDYTFIQTQFLYHEENTCCVIASVAGDRGSDGPVVEISVVELRRRGLGHLEVADLNRDGWLDVHDIAAFAAGVRPVRPEWR